MVRRRKGCKELSTAAIRASTALMMPTPDLKFNQPTKSNKCVATGLQEDPSVDQN